MKPALLALLLVAACSSASEAPVAAPTTPAPTVAPTTAAPTAVPTTQAPTPTPTASPEVGPVGTPVPAGFEPRSATFVSDRTGWVLGSAGGKAVVVRTRDGGRTWRAVPAPAAPPDDLATLRFAGLRDGFATGAQLWATHDGGATWAVVPGHPAVRALEAARGRVWLLQGRQVLSGPATGGALQPEATGTELVSLTVHGDQALVGDGSTGQLRLLRHGSAPQPVRTPCEQYDGPATALLDDRTWLLVCAGEPAAGTQPKTAWRSADAGRTWERRGEPAPSSGTAVFATDRADFVVDDRQVGVSRDGDRTWSTSLASDGLLEGGFVSSALGYAIGGLPGDDRVAMRVTRDTGRSWQPVAF